jgi:cytochrome c-type biogenesis protein CcmF
MVGSSVAHIGFGVLLLGVLVSSANKEVISINQTQFQLNPEFDDQANREHVLLERGKPLRMGDYEIEYTRDTQMWVNTYYEVQYKKIDRATNQVLYSFNLYPNAQVNPKMGLVANPDTKHYISHDVFTYVSSIPKERESNKYHHEKTETIKQGDTIVTNYGYVILNKVLSNTNTPEQINQGLDLMLTAYVTVQGLTGSFDVQPIYGIRAGEVVDVPAIIDPLRLRIRFTGVNPNTGEINLETAELDTSGDFIIMKAIVFPWINLVWAGTIIMIVGFLLAIWRRISEKVLAK